MLRNGWRVEQEANWRSFLDPPVLLRGPQVHYRYEVEITTSKLRGEAMGWLLTMPGEKRYWLTAARTLASTPGPADLMIFRSEGLPVLSTIIPTTTLVSSLSRRAVLESATTSTL